MSSQVFWRTPFEPLASAVDLFEFTVLDVEPSGPTRGKWVLADAQVALNGAFRSSNTGTKTNGSDDMDYDDEGRADGMIYHTRTHLGGILQPGDAVLGYHLTRSNFNSDAFSALPSSRIPDVILVRKTYPNRRKKNRTRNWRLKSIAKEAAEEDSEGVRGGVIGRMGGRDQKKVEEDYELFLREIEEDDEMRSAMNLYKRPGAGSGMAGGKTRGRAKDVAGTMDVDGEVSTVAVPSNVNAETADEENEEPDFPEVRLDELLDDFDEMTLGHSGET